MTTTNDTEIERLCADLQARVKELTALVLIAKRSSQCKQHRWFGGGCPCDCHDTQPREAP